MIYFTRSFDKHSSAFLQDGRHFRENVISDDRVQPCHRQLYTKDIPRLNITQKLMLRHSSLVFQIDTEITLPKNCSSRNHGTFTKRGRLLKTIFFGQREIRYNPRAKKTIYTTGIYDGDSVFSSAESFQRRGEGVYKVRQSSYLSSSIGGLLYIQRGRK